MKTCSHADTSQKQTNAKVNSWLYLLERFDVGVVHLDSNIRVLGMNDYARRCLPVQEKMPFGKIVTDFHPEAARPKVKFLLGQAECPVNNAPPMAMMINIPERVLLIKVSKLSDELGAATGYTLVFYDITEVVSQEVDDVPGAKGQEVVKRQFRKIPTVKQTAQGGQFCNLTIGDLESRLDPQCFLRVHRSYIVNLSQVDEIVRDDGRMTLRMMGSTPVEIPVSRSSVARLMDQLGLTDAISAKV
jgi:hypothetical protein